MNRLVQAYDAIAEAYAGDGHSEDDPQWRNACREAFLGPLSGPRILDAACGPGQDGAHFLGLGHQVVGLDITPNFLHIAQRRYPEMALLRGDLRALPMASGAFDGIYCMAALPHLSAEDLALCLQEFARVLKKGGMALVGLIHSDRMAQYTLQDWGGVKGNAMTFYCHPPQRAAELFKALGFARVEHLEISSTVYDSLPRLVKRGVRQYQLRVRR
jgi:ubiquinone/menaquinone biosynthesis C-methylase UbiE